MNTHKGMSSYKQALLIFVLATWTLLWQQSAFATNDPDVTGDGRVNTLDVSPPSQAASAAISPRSHAADAPTPTAITS